MTPMLFIVNGIETSSERVPKALCDTKICKCYERLQMA